MNKRHIFALFVIMLFPAAALADPLSFQPPTTDVSVIFLSNIFGIVDGVLHGTGSQIVGQMFAVFNAALLALGGLLLVYVIIVSTLNTAHQGEPLGQRWSSLWNPLRLVIGLGLLVPKSTGYCLLQVILMWIVVQGVGAADKVWNAALNYLNRGGVIVQAQEDPTVAMAAGNSDIAKGATAILAGQVCMIGLQQQLTSIQTIYKSSGSCSQYSGSSWKIKKLCENDIPDFVNSVNAVTEQSLNPNSATIQVPMPNLNKANPYSFLNGKCGYIQFNSVSVSSTMTQGLSDSDKQTVAMSRAVAVQQMYMDLSSVAQTMVQNDPSISPQGEPIQDQVQSYTVDGLATNQFGIPLNQSNQLCTSIKGCTSWGSDTYNSYTSAVLFVGTEFQGAIADYNGIMMPTLNLQAQKANSDQVNSAKKFINDAEAQGWMMAGSYFFSLAKLNDMGMGTPGSGQLVDKDSGLQNSKFDKSQIACADDTSTLCSWFGDNFGGKLKAIVRLINGSSGDMDTTNMVPMPTSFPSTSALSGEKALTVFGYITNASILQLPSQAGFKPPAFQFKVPLNITVPIEPLGKVHYGCQGFMCIPSLVAEVLWNLIIRYFYNMTLYLISGIINQVVMAFLSMPLQIFGDAFNQGLSILQTPNVNPVIALAKMGGYYINYSMNMWLELISISITTSLFAFPLGFLLIMGMVAIALPLILAWTGTMLAIGFSTAYYVPFLPYMIFTFGSIAWLIGVIEAMVAGPIVALGVSAPEGHDVMGQSSQALMLILNVFLRPTLMIIGYIVAIALTYVGVWILNAGFQNAVAYIISGETLKEASSGLSWLTGSTTQSKANDMQTSGYSDWAAIYAQFFAVLTYTTLYLVIVQKAFTLITHLPDKVLTWVGGQQSSLGEMGAQWVQEGKKGIEEGQGATSKAGAQTSKKLKGATDNATSQIGADSQPPTKGGGGPSMSNR